MTQKNPNPIREWSLVEPIGTPGRIAQAIGKLKTPDANLDEPGHPSRLDAGNMAWTSKALGLRVGLVRGTNPHGLRHRGSPGRWTWSTGMPWNR